MTSAYRRVRLTWITRMKLEIKSVQPAPETHKRLKTPYEFLPALNVLNSSSLQLYITLV